MLHLDTEGMALAKGLLTTGGLIVGFPALAPVVVTAAIYGTTLGGQKYAKKAKLKEEESKCVEKIHDDLQVTIQALQDVNSRGIEKFAGACSHMISPMN